MFGWYHITKLWFWFARGTHIGTSGVNQLVWFKFGWKGSCSLHQDDVVTGGLLARVFGQSEQFSLCLVTACAGEYVGETVGYRIGGFLAPLSCLRGRFAWDTGFVSRQGVPRKNSWFSSVTFPNGLVILGHSVYSRGLIW